MAHRTIADVAGMFRLLASPTRVRILLELGEGPRGTTALAAATGRALGGVSVSLTALRLGGLVESTRVGKRREHGLTAGGRVMVDGLMKLAAA